MRRNILHVGAQNLKYEIREIVGAAREIEALGKEITWENIGDPIEKGESPPKWIREIVADLVDQAGSWAYCDSQGVPEVREFLANEVNGRNGVRVTADDIIFFNGLGDAVAKVYGFLRREARILGPSPAYSSHSSAEAAHSGYEHVTYELDPYDGWMPDLEDIRNKVRYNDSIAGILLLSPDNPTGAVYPRDLLEEIAAIARENDIATRSDTTIRSPASCFCHRTTPPERCIPLASRRSLARTTSSLSRTRFTPTSYTTVKVVCT